MYEWFKDPINILNLMTSVLLLTFGATARTIKVLKRRDISVKDSFVEWLDNQFTALPIGIIALVVIPELYPELKPSVLNGIMIAVGILANELFNLARVKITKETSKLKETKSAQEE